jgi:hypothetical protein
MHALLRRRGALAHRALAYAVTSGLAFVVTLGAVAAYDDARNERFVAMEEEGEGQAAQARALAEKGVTLLIVASVGALVYVGTLLIFDRPSIREALLLAARQPRRPLGAAATPTTGR